MTPTKKVLVIEDNSAMAGLLIDVVASCGGAAEWCASAPKASVRVEEVAFDLIICDNDLGERDAGLQFCDMLDRLKMAVPVILYTGQCPDRIPRIGGRLVPVVIKPNSTLLRRYVEAIS